jgi:hypothetical protein
VVPDDAGGGDWILCQVTSKAYGDSSAIRLENTSLAVGSLRVTSYAGPGKLFAASQSLIASQIGKLKPQPFRKITDSVMPLLRAGVSHS